MLGQCDRNTQLVFTDIQRFDGRGIPVRLPDPLQRSDHLHVVRRRHKSQAAKQFIRALLQRGCQQGDMRGVVWLGAL